MDSAGYGPVTIDKAISIIAPPSVHAAIAPTSGDAITIATGIAFPVILRGLYLNGQGGMTGIVQQGNNELFVEGCVINGFSNGILFQTGVQPHFFITDTTIRNNDGNGITWLGSAPAGGTIDHCRFERNSGSGFGIEGGGTFTIRDTVAADNYNGVEVVLLTDVAAINIIDSAASRNTGSGFRIAPNPGGTVTMHFEHCLSSSNGVGLEAAVTMSGTAIMRVSNCLITNNQYGVFTAGGAEIQSRGNNTLESNDSFNIFTTSYTSK
jgi:hypothetical protein